METDQNEGVFPLSLTSVHLDEIKTPEEPINQGLLSDDQLTAISDDLPLHQVTSDKIQYIQVFDENNEVQLLQLTCDGDAASLVQLVSGTDSGEQLVIQCSLPSVTEADRSFLEQGEKVGLLSTENMNLMIEDERNQNGFMVSKNALDSQEETGVTGLDLNRPIALTEDTVVIIDDEKCVLRLEPNTRNLIAYPIKDDASSDMKNNVTTKRKRGRPPKTVKKPDSTGLVDHSTSSVTDPSKNFVEEKAEDSEEEKSGAAECLLGLADGRRKSSRVKKKPSQLSDYETEQKEDTSEHPLMQQNVQGVLVSVPNVQEMANETTGLAAPKLATPNQMQNFLANLGLPVKRGRGRPRRKPLPISADIYNQVTNVQRLLPALLPKVSPIVLAPAPASTPPMPMKETAIIIQQEDGSEKHILVSSAAEPAISFAPIAPAAVDCKQESDSGFTQTSADIDAAQTMDGVISFDGCSEIPASSAVFQISNQLIPLAAQRSQPVKIGPKMRDEELANLRCAKCDFQALYSHQLQQHIAEQHANDSAELFKCKCCSFLSFSKDGLSTHFRECHPKCICYVCGFMAEHSYIVKRHMQRHDTTGCECSICGKKYKDQYILKMHFKMVHMPAEVLFQCQICFKEFTRKAHLKRHLRIHNPDKPFKCPHCEYRGCERSDINKHLLIHNEPKYSCEICFKTFRHIKNKELHVRRHQNQRDYTCGICGFLGYTFTDIRKHIERKHMDTRHICSRCGGTFKTDALLRDHLCDFILLEQALEASGAEAGEECYANEPIQLVTEDQSLLSDPRHVIISSNPGNICLETLTLPEESLQLMENPMEQEQIIGEV